MFTPDQKTAFARRSGPTVDRAFLDLSSNWSLGRWLNSKNRYRHHCVRKLTDDFGPGRRIRHRDLIQYITASVLVHCLDGWSYLGRSLAAQMAGDADCSRHLGYYAELRAAMGILGAHGIGVFSLEHVVVDSRSRCLRMPPRRSNPTRPSGLGTHKFVWEALAEWTDAADAKDCLLGAIRGGGKTLEQWLDQFGAVPVLNSKLAREWLISWGLDISRLAEDRDARNLSSYRPTAFTTSRPTRVEETIIFVSHLWSTCEPSTESPFAMLDRQLIRSSLRAAFKATRGRSHRQAKVDFKRTIQTILHWLMPTPTGFNWEEYLLEESSDPLEVLVLASGQDGPESQYHNMQVAARAFLLLRVATGTCEHLLSLLPLGVLNDLNFWVDAIGEDRGLWEPTSKPGNMQDLWKDSEDALEALRLDLPRISSYAALREFQPIPSLVLSSCERAALWGMRM